MAPDSWIIFAFVIALVVLAAAGAVSGPARRGVRQFVGDVRAGLRREPDAGAIGLLASARQDLATVAEEQPDDGGVADLFRVGEVPDTAYVDPTPVTDKFARVSRSLRGLVRG